MAALLLAATGTIDSTSDQLVIFARSPRITTCVIVPKHTASVFVISRWLRPSTHFSRRILE